MGRAYGVSSACLRYIVPFVYQGTFEDACVAVERQREVLAQKDPETGKREATGEYRNLWVRKVSSMGGTESDLYDYIKNEILFDGEELDLKEEKPGCQWVHWRSEESKYKDGQKIAELLYFADGIQTAGVKQSPAWDIAITNECLVLYRNGLGLVWYEIVLPTGNIDSEALKKFQNTIKELNRGERTLFWKKCREEPAYGLIAETSVNPKTGQQHHKYIAPFSFGMWIQDNLHFLAVDYLAARKAAYFNMLRKTMKYIAGLKAEGAALSTIGDETVEADLAYRYTTAPDKAILFTYCAFDGDGEEREALTFHLANGYKDSYHLSNETVADMKKPFSNVIWYATQEGAAYLSWPFPDNRDVFTGLIPSKVKTDYFTLYLKVLYQSLSLLVYAQRIQREISAVSDRYLTERPDTRITDLFIGINLFLTKSMATSVSHIHHQSEFYIYLKEQLRIHSDVESVTAGLNTLDALQREQRQREESLRIAQEWQEEQRRDREAEQLRLASEERQKKAEEAEKRRDNHIQAGVGLFSILAIGSALIDMYDFIGKLVPGSEGGWGELLDCWPILAVEIVFTAIIIVIGGFACKFTWQAFKESKKGITENPMDEK